MVTCYDPSLSVSAFCLEHSKMRMQFVNYFLNVFHFIFFLSILYLYIYIYIYIYFLSI